MNEEKNEHSIHGADPVTRLASCLYRLLDIQHETACPLEYHHDNSHDGWLLIHAAEGRIAVNGRTYSLRQPTLFWLTPGATVQFFLPAEDQAAYDCVCFQAFESDGRGGLVPAHLPNLEPISPRNVDSLAEKIREARQMLQRGDAWEAMRANILFQEMILGLLREHAAPPKPDAKQGIALTLSYMEEHYPAAITREQLARMAGLQPDYYSRAFKKLVRLTPLEYLTGIRMKHARQLLVQSKGESLRTIAHKVGFSDEFYFSRRFKAETGHSPAAFVKKIRSGCKIAALNHQATGHLLALGIEPYAAVVNGAFPLSARLKRTIAIGDSFPDLEKLVRAQPDVMVTRILPESEPTAKEKLLEQIAPTVALSQADDWRTHFQTIASIVGKEERAREWLDRYDHQAAEIRRQLQRVIGDESILVVGIGVGKMCVYGMRNVGAVLYGDLGVQVPKGVAEIGHYREVTMAGLTAFEADRILVTSYRHDGSKRMDEAVGREISALSSCTEWRGLQAVQTGKVSFLHDARHLYTSYNAHSHDLLLQKMAQLLLPAFADHNLLTR